MASRLACLTLYFSTAAYLLCTAVAHQMDKTAAKDPEGRLFSLFTLIRFNNDLCEISKSEEGICYSNSECASKGGVGKTSCASGFGVCCQFLKTCGGKTGEKVSYFVNPGYDNTDGAVSRCSFMVEVSDPDVCQIRVDFTEFEIGGPNAGICNPNSLTVTTSTPRFLGLTGANDNQLCGKNRGQHLYIPADLTTGKDNIELSVTSDDKTKNKWKMKARQVDCTKNNKLEAPTGCLQYFMDMTGTIKSFNFDGSAGSYFVDLDYAICFRRDSNVCGIEYTKAIDDDFNVNGLEKCFVMAGTGPGAPTPAPNACWGDANCDQGAIHDYLSIPGSRAATQTTRFEKFCGAAFGIDAVTDNMKPKDSVKNVLNTTPGPITIRFHTDSSNTPAERERGFQIKYQMMTKCP